jgi:hypothetical protein
MCQHGYCGKQGQPHSQQDFDAFNRLESTLFWLWPVGMLTAYFLQRKPRGPSFDDIRATYKVDRGSDDTG